MSNASLFHCTDKSNGINLSDFAETENRFEKEANAILPLKSRNVFLTLQCCQNGSDAGTTVYGNLLLGDGGDHRCPSIPTIRPLFDKKVWMSRSSAERSGPPHSNASRKLSKSWIKTVDSDTITLKSVPSTRWETKHERDDVESYREEIMGKIIE
jgi:hypothetical protein